MEKQLAELQVDTSPTKEVVVDSLTRDISVEACIFDLLDNSVDAAMAVSANCDSEVNDGEDVDPYSGYYIDLFLSGELLSIQDNCGGIGHDQLKEMVFRFGQRSKHEKGIGIYGVGLNRALFKLGRVSHVTTDTGSERAGLVLDTKQYLETEEWLLPAYAYPTSGEQGTKIEISQIPEDIARVLADSGETGRLIRKIGQRYGRFIDKGLGIKVNGDEVQSEEIVIREDGPFNRVSKLFKTDSGVTIVLEFGQHLNHRFTSEEDYDQAQNKKLTDDFGWNVYCNDRAVLIADKSWKTGWDTKFHTEFYGFVGNVRFVDVDPANLPWNTTKTDVDLNSAVYETALFEMRSFAQEWRQFANYAKTVKRKKGTLKGKPKEGAKDKNKNKNKNKNTKKKTQNEGKKKTSRKKDHNQFSTVLPMDVNEKYCYDKHLALLHEAKKHDIGDLPYAGLALIRILFEVSVVQYLMRHDNYSQLIDFVIERRKKKIKLSDADEKKVIPKMEEMIPFLENTPEAWGAQEANYLRQTLRTMGEKSKKLNGVVHNPFQPIHRSEAYQIRDAVIPLLRHLIEN